MAKDWRRPTEAARRHWKQREAGQTSTAARGVKRLIFTLLSVVLIGVLIWYLIPRGQKVYFAYLGEDYGPTLRNPAKVEVATLAPPVASSSGVYRSEFAPLGERIFPKQFTVADVADGGNSKLAAAKLVESLTAPLKDKWNLDQVEFLVLYVSAHGVAIDGEPYLMWNEDYAAEFARRSDGKSQPSLMKFDDLLAQIKELGAKQKLLMLDCGQFYADPRLGLFVNEFPRLAEQRAAAVGDRSLWVFTSHAAMQQAHIYAADRTSVFGHFVSRGVAGASRSRDDEDLSLRQFVEYVVSEVGKTVASRTGKVQTPRIVNGDLGVLAASDVPNITFLKQDFFNRDVEIAAAPRRAPNADRVAAIESPRGNSAGGAAWPAAFALLTLGQTPTTDGQGGAAAPTAAPPASPEGTAAQPATPSGDANKTPATTEGAPPAAGEATPTTPATNSPSAPPPAAANPVAAPANQTPADAAATPAAGEKPAAAGDDKKKGPPAALDFAEVWSRVAKIEDPMENPAAWSPVDYAPHLWAQLRRQLVWYQARYEIERDNRAENSAYIAAEILAPLDGLLLGDGGESASVASSLDLFSELRRARDAFRNGAAYASAADDSRRSVQNFKAAVRLKNYLTYRVAEQVRHYGYVADPTAARHDALAAAIAELQKATTQLETETRSSLNEEYWTSSPDLLLRLRTLRARLHESPDIQRHLHAVGTVPAEAPPNVARAKPPGVTDRQPALWVDLYLKLVGLSQRDETAAPPSDVAILTATGGSDAKLAEYVDRIRRIGEGSAPRADEGEYWQAYRAVGLQVRRFAENLEVALRRSADAAHDDATLAALERRLRLVDGRDAAGMSARDNAIPQRRFVPPIAARVELILADTKIGLPPRSAGSAARKVIAPAYRWNGEVGAMATVRVLYENQAAGSKIVQVVSPPAEVRLSAQGTLPDIVLEQAEERRDKTNTETAKLRLVVEVTGSQAGPTVTDILVEAHGSELVELAAYRVRDNVDFPIDSRRDDEMMEELPEPRITDGNVKARLFQIRVRPFPNRPDQYRFKLTNVSGESGTRDVRVDVLEVRRPVADPLDTIRPNGLLDMKYFRVVEQFQRELSLSSNAPQTFPFVEPAKPAAEGEAKPPAAAAPPPAEEKKDAGPPTPVADFHNGLVFRIADKNKPELFWYYWVDFRARRPDRYVESIVTYDSNRGRLEILIRPRSDATPPPDGFSAKWTADGATIDPQLSRTMEVLKKRDDEIRLNVNGWYPPEPAPGKPPIPLFVTVDDYPRAFVHMFTPAVSPGVPVRPTLSFQRVKIVDPPRDLFAYKKDQPGEVHVNVGIEADGLPSDTAVVTFADGNNAPKPIESWRAEHLWLYEKGWDKENVLTLTSFVGDHVGADAIAFDTTLVEQPIDVGVELRSGETTKSEDSLKVIVDEQPPSLSMGDPSPRTAKAVKGLEVTVAPTVFDRGGVARIEFFIFADSKERLADEEQKKPDYVWPPPDVKMPPIVDQKAVPVTIPFDRGPGRWSIWAVAVNQVERRSLPVRTTNPFDVEEAMEETKPEKGGGVTIVGITTLYDKPLANVSLKLVPLEEGKGSPQSTTSVDPTPVDFVDEAAYKFESVPPGEYKITASGKASNGRTVVGEVPKVVITDKDTGTKTFDIKLALP